MFNASNRKRFSEMSLTALRAYAKDVHGLTGLSKAPREIVQGRINAARQPKPMSAADRAEVYRKQRGFPEHQRTGRLTHRQSRRVRKTERKERG